MKLRNEWLCDECSTPEKKIYDECSNQGRHYYCVSKKVIEQLEKNGEASVTVTFPSGRKKVFSMKEDDE
jgi:hypothetical protein